jgi:hypothetical protein
MDKLPQGFIAEMAAEEARSEECSGDSVDTTTMHNRTVRTREHCTGAIKDVLLTLRNGDGATAAACRLIDFIRRLEPAYRSRYPATALVDAIESTMPDGWTAWRWPEFKDLCARLGIAWDRKCKSLSITFTEDKIAIEQVYLPGEPPEGEAEKWIEYKRRVMKEVARREAEGGE